MTAKKKKLLIIATAAAAAAAVAVVLWINAANAGGKTEQNPTSAVNPSKTASDAISAQETSDTAPGETFPVKAPEGTQTPVEPTTVAISVFTGENDGVTVFDGEFVPDSRAEDITTGKIVRLRELFGANAASGSIIFRSDGTFTDSLSPAGLRSGSYSLTDGGISAVYLPDETMDITVTEWNGDKTAPAAFSVVYRTVGDKGYRVFFTEK